MANKHAKKISVPSLTEIQSERKRIRRGTYYRQTLRGTVSVLLVVAAIAVLITTLFPIISSRRYKNKQKALCYHQGNQSPVGYSFIVG